MHVTASQIRQDLNHFGGFGQQGYGYNIEFLQTEIAKILGLDNKDSFQGARGKLEEGFLANLVLVDLNEEWTIDSSKFKTKGKICPFENMDVVGKVLATWFKGEKVF